MASAALPALRPLALGELLDRTIRLYRSNFFRFIGIIAVVQIPFNLLALLTTVPFLVYTRSAQENPGEYLAPFFGFSLLTTLVSFVGGILYQSLASAALTRAVVDGILGTPASVFGAYRRIGSTWWKLILALLLMSLINILLVIWTIVPCAGWLTGPGMLVFCTMIVLPLISPAIVIENVGVTQAIRRAWDLARRRFWWVVGFALILALFAQLITTGPSLLISSGLSYLLRESLDPTQIQLIQTIIQSLSGMILSLIYMPLQLTAITLLYFDLRVRTEGLDIQLQLGSEPAGPQPDWHSFLAEKAPAPENTGLVTGRELGSFALLTLAVIGIYLAFIALVLPFTMLSMSSRGF